MISNSSLGKGAWWICGRVLYCIKLHLASGCKECVYVVTDFLASRETINEPIGWKCARARFSSFFVYLGKVSALKPRVAYELDLVTVSGSCLLAVRVHRYSLLSGIPIADIEIPILAK